MSRSTRPAAPLGQVAPHEAGIASGIVSTFHEFGASIGAAAISSVAAVSLLTGVADGYRHGFAAAAGAAALAAAVAVVITPRRAGSAPAAT